MANKKEIYLMITKRLDTGIETVMDFTGYYYNRITDEIEDQIEEHGFYLLSQDNNREVYFKKIFEFEADLEFLEFRRGCSAAGAVFVKQGDREKLREKYFITNNYYMFLSDLSDLIRSEQRIDRIHGIFTYTKKGQSVGIKLVKRLD